VKRLTRTKRVTVLLSEEMYSALLDYAYLTAKREMRRASIGELIRELLGNELRRRNNHALEEEEESSRDLLVRPSTGQE
jgi:hypothetical protein